MSTALALPEGCEDEVARLRTLLVEEVEQRKARPLDFAKRLPHQAVAWSLLVDGTHPDGSKLERQPREVVLVAANRSGKTEVGGMITAQVARGASRYTAPLRAWTGAESLAESGEGVEEKLDRWLPRGEVGGVVGRTNALNETRYRMRNGSEIRCRSYEQRRARWQVAKLAMVWLDEQAPDDVTEEARARLIDLGGVLLHTFTPLKGTGTALYRLAHEPWQDYLKTHQGARYGEVRPGLWVITAGMRDNVESVGGYLPDEGVEQYERQLLDAGRPSEARVRVHGDWLDVSEDAIFAYEELRYYSEPPAQGYAERVYHLDGAQTTSPSGCRSSIALCGKRRNGEIDVIDTHGGHWNPDDRAREVVDFVQRNGDAVAYVQKTTVDVEMCGVMNRMLAEKGSSTRFIPRDVKVIDKLGRANAFAPYVANGIFGIRPEHVELERQIRNATPEAFKAKGAKGAIDDIDAAMAAAQALLDIVSADDYAHAVAQAGLPEERRSNPEEWPDDEEQESTDWAWQGSVWGRD